jgi:hypothetical protein
MLEGHMTLPKVNKLTVTDTVTEEEENPKNSKA